MTLTVMLLPNFTGNRMSS